MVVTNTLKIMGATMLLLATSNGVGVNVRLVGYGLFVSRYQGIFRRCQRDDGNYASATRTTMPALGQQSC